MPDNDVILVLITVPDSETADRIATVLIDKRLAACVSIIPGLKSVYRWKDEICRDDEFLLTVKSVSSKFELLKREILANHPYDLPEIISIKIQDGLEGYLEWVASETE